MARGLTKAELLESAERTLAANAEAAARLALQLGELAAQTDSAHVRAQGATTDSAPERWAYVATHAENLARLANALKRSAWACCEMAEQVQGRSAALAAEK